MKKSFNSLLSWLSSWQQQTTQTEEQTPPMPEHESRLRELQRSGRMLFLP